MGEKQGCPKGTTLVNHAYQDCLCTLSTPVRTYNTAKSQVVHFNSKHGAEVPGCIEVL